MLLAIDAIVPSSAFVHRHCYEMIRRHQIGNSDYARMLPGLLFPSMLLPFDHIDALVKTILCTDVTDRAMTPKYCF
jgi:hypothetical protein